METRRKPSMLKVFAYGGEKDLFIQNVGYDDFEFVEPIKYLRVQPDYTLHFVLKGSGKLFLAGKEFNVRERQLFFLPPNKEIMYYPAEDAKDGEKWRYFWFYFSGAEAAKLGLKMGFDLEHPIITPRSPEMIEDIIMSVMSAMASGDANEYKAKSALFSVVGEIVGGETTSAGRSELAEQALRYISVNSSNPDFTIESLCTALYTSHSTLCKIFGEKYGMSPMKKLTDLKMNTAAKLLSETNLSIKEAAAMAGYRDEIHFMKMFKKYFGMTATDYREKAEKAGSVKKPVSGRVTPSD